jgi:Phage integrase, N-terminal SAM-like domain
MKWKKTKFPGIRYRTHPTRKHGIAKDQYFAIRYQFGGTRQEEGLGWASEGWSLEKALVELAALKKNYRLGENKPTSLEEKRNREKERRKAEAEKRRKADRDLMTLGDFFDSHYLPFCQISKNEGILKRTKQHFKTWIKPSLGKYPVKDIRPIHVERLKKTMFDANKAPRTVQHVLASLRQVWNQD